MDNEQVLEFFFLVEHLTDVKDAEIAGYNDTALDVIFSFC